MTAPTIRTAIEPDWVGDVLRFWFIELTPQAWFKRHTAVDATIVARFNATHEAVAAMGDAALTSNPRTALAAVIVLDQFPRNLFRGEARAFTTDAKARALADAAVTLGFDRELDKDGRLFLYLPFEHSEGSQDQARAVALIGALGDAELTRFAEAHKAIIDRFGRFPHRNAALGRQSTPEELAFLEQPGSSF